MQTPKLILKNLLEKDSWSPEEQEWLLHYLEQEDTPELSSLLLEQFSDDIKHDIAIPTGVSERLLQKIQLQIGDVNEHTKPPRIGRWKRLAAAAAILIMLLSGSYFLFRKDKSPQPVAKKENQGKDVAAPNTSTSVITLANGQQVLLSSARNGTLATQGNVTVTKTADGRIVYNGTAKEIQYNTLSNPRGSKAVSLTLGDGTVVLLNAGSSLRYPTAFSGKLRKVEIMGEGFFDVVKAANRPFIIHTAKMDVRVLGTRFNVKAYREDKTTETSLIMGSIEVSLKNNPGKKYLLKPNQKLILSNDQPVKAAKIGVEGALPEIAGNRVAIMPLTYLAGTETNIESSWTKNLLSFEDEAFVDVARRMERWYNVSIEFKNRRWENKFLSGSFEKESLEQALKTLKYTTGFNYKIEDNKIAIY